MNFTGTTTPRTTHGFSHSSDPTTMSSMSDAVIFVASIHHMDFESAVARAKSLLSPQGRLIIVGCAKPDGPADMLIEAARVIPAKLGSIAHGERSGGEIGVPTMVPSMSLAQIREVARRLLPGAKLRRGLYYRYLLTWN